MNAPEIPLVPQRAIGVNPILDTLLGQHLDAAAKAKRIDLLTACGWKNDSSISQILKGNAGVMLVDLEPMLEVLGLTIVEKEYMDYLATGNTIGANCCRARASQGFCRAR